MKEYNYTPINLEKLDRKTKTFIRHLDAMIKKAPTIKKVCVDPARFRVLHDTMSDDSRAFYQNEIPYKGIIIYSFSSIHYGEDYLKDKNIITDDSNCD